MEMIIQTTPTFNKWFRGLKDSNAKASVSSHVDRLMFGLYGDVKPVGGGISELKINVGKGYRVYFKKRNKVITILLCGGNKKTQDKDIKLAKQLAKDLNM
ncbi:TPA: type II toxin-antitoxin system RelE/ParE family toxin [Vibrio parahaemolyticus]|nr:type II toxin-antitoxin system RelE/ParE family toxin [Vibrio parahaemolyticus]TOH19113.1 hypothetical protein CGI90_03810 [Vibrio parahaemolyticus]HCG7330521.1 type II toxin-antitoxin system RelE/ParE family toxin [Vibrio parahaemolyticus]HCG9589100.1 type II toxin-antitoxin system RelE/ParE family toxin [Vibrio parahaemolyticus]HCM0798049.1 type II toxin-antitoxin system RelE/ParE family toxin [Vibrio parahaemolyticus]